MALEGTLKDITLNDLFEIFSTYKKSGILILVNDYLLGKIYIHNGQVIDAEMIRNPNQQSVLSGEAAAIHILRWTQAQFSFTYDSRVPTRPIAIHQNNYWLLLQAAQSQSPFPIGLTLDTLIDANSEAYQVETFLGLDVIQWQILDCVNVRKTIRSIISETHLSSEDALSVVGKMIIAQLLRITTLPYTNTLSLVSPSHRTTARQSAPRLRSALLQAIQRRVRSL